MTSATKSIVVEYDLPQSPGQVWRALTEPALLEGWLMPNDIAPVVGHAFHFHTRPQGGWDGVVWCDVSIVEPERRLRYSWRGGDPKNTGSGHTLDTVVTWTLTPAGSGTLLRLDHDGFRDEDRFAYEAMGSGWRTHVRDALLEVETRLAVYGTLAPGRENHAMLAPLSGTWSNGVVRGHRIEAGWGSLHGFPGVRLDPSGDDIAVQLFHSSDLPAHWQRLDDFEGAEYERAIVAVRQDGENVLASIYAIRAP